MFRKHLWIIFFVLLFGIQVVSIVVLADEHSPNNIHSTPSFQKIIILSSTQPITDTGIELTNNDTVVISATGNTDINYSFCPSNPNGSTCTWPSGTAERALLPTAKPGSLLVRIGNSPWQFAGTGPASFSGLGRIILGFNDCAGCYADNSGNYQIEINVDSQTSICGVSQDSTTGIYGCIISPRDNTTISESTILFQAQAGVQAENGQSPVPIQQVEFYVYYDGSWHNAGLDTIHPYETIWQVPNNLHSQQLRFRIDVTDNLLRKLEFAGGVHRVNFVESLIDTTINENWIPTRLYLNQRYLTPDGDIKCSVASMAMMLAMNSIIGNDYITMANKANEMFPKVRRNDLTYINLMTAELQRQGLTAIQNAYNNSSGWKIIRQEVDAGRPIIVRTKHGIVTKDGHYVIAVGYREASGKHEIIAYDPYGHWKGNCCTQNYNKNRHNDPLSTKGQWVYYDFNKIFGDYLIVAKSPQSFSGHSTLTSTVSSPPDVVSDEVEDVGTYTGVIEEVGNFLYLPVVQK